MVAVIVDFTKFGRGDLSIPREETDAFTALVSTNTNVTVSRLERHETDYNPDVNVVIASKSGDLASVGIEFLSSARDRALMNCSPVSETLTALIDQSVLLAAANKIQPARN